MPNMCLLAFLSPHDSLDIYLEQILSSTPENL